VQILSVKYFMGDKAVGQEEYCKPEKKVVGFPYFCNILHPELLEASRIILGIDPGTTVMGYGIIGIKGNKIELLAIGILKLNKYDDHALRLKNIFDRTIMLIDEYHPDELAIEAPFYGKNVQSMLKLGRAQGVAFAAALSRSVPVFEYAPRKIKQSITGKGNASKEQVSAMLQRLIPLSGTPETFDASDALAAAVCHYFQRGKSSAKKNYTGWKSFLAANPDKAG